MEVSRGIIWGAKIFYVLLDPWITWKSIWFFTNNLGTLLYVWYFNEKFTSE